MENKKKAKEGKIKKLYEAAELDLTGNQFSMDGQVEMMRRHEDRLRRMNALREDPDDDDAESEEAFDKEDSYTEEGEFDFDEYQKSHHLDNLFDFSKYAKKNKLSLRTMPIFVQIEILNNGSHFSEDKFNLAIVQALMMLIFVALAFVNFKKY